MSALDSTTLAPPRLQSNLAVLAVLLVTSGCALAIVFGYVSGLKLLLAVVALAGSVLFLLFPEMALASLLVVGTLKGMPQLASSPVDLTVALTALVLLGGLLKGGKDLLSLQVNFPKAYLLYLPLLGIMLVSLTYTPNFPAGAEKVGRFVIFCGIAIVGPFLVIRSKASLTRYFMTVAGLGLLVAINSFSSLGGKSRLTPDGGDTIQLGHDAALAIVIIWYLLLPRRGLLSRLLLYSVVVALSVAMIGSGSRGPVVGLTCCIVLSFFLHKKLGIQFKSLLVDLGLLIGAGLAIIPIVGIPQSSFDYLARLGDPNLHHTLGPREALMALGWKLTLDHPLRGVGIGGYPVLFRGIGAWPHNMFLEISSEMGVFAALLFVFIVYLAFREALRQLNSPDPAYRILATVVFAFFTLEFIGILNTGSLIDNRAMWMAIALPFVLKNLRTEEMLIFQQWIRRYKRTNGERVMAKPGMKFPIHAHF